MKKDVALSSILLSLAVLSLIPVAMMISMSFRDGVSIMTNFWGYPMPPEWQNYVNAIHTVLGPLLRSLYVSGMSILGILFFSWSCGYALARHNFVGKRLLYGSVITMITIPSVVLLTPDFMLASWLHLRESLQGLIVFYVGSGQLISIYLFCIFFRAIPEEIFECARIDGANEWRCLHRIAIPLAKPITVVVIITSFMTIYNDIMWPLLMLSRPSLTLLAVALVGVSGNIPLGFAADTIACAPLLLLLSFGMRHFVAGLTSGAIKA